MEMNNEMEDRLRKLEEKYMSMGQDINSYLDGLLLSNYLNYWDYIRTDTLLTLQNPKTDFPDEMVFIIYHQITELYFKLCLHELKQIAHNGPVIENNGHFSGWNKTLSVDFFIARMKRVNRYFGALTHSFEIMIEGMEREQFLRYRMALLPASGFQSAQYRLVEIYATDLVQLVDKDERSAIASESTIENMMQKIYWNKGATELESGKKTLTLKQFENKYLPHFIDTAKELQENNIWQKYLGLGDADKKNPELIEQLKQFDLNVNVNWPLMHYKSAARYLGRTDKDVPATGGTNWQKYLPPRFQRRIFYPELWSKEELENWGVK